METLLINLRNKKLSIEDFRKAADKVAVLLAKEVAKYLNKEKVATSNIVLVPVLRSGVVLLHPFLQIFLTSKVGFIGLKRNEKTLKPKAYYHNLPKIKKQDKVIVIDPMLATGGSALATIKDLINAGAAEKNIIFAGLISSPEGIANLQKNFPHIEMFIAVQDKGLDKKGYIVPGLGDFGDRYFGTTK